MISQLNLRFHKKLIDALKTRAGRENTSVNALAERYLDDGLKTAAAGDGYFQLLADPETTIRQLYRKIVAGMSLGGSRSPGTNCGLCWSVPDRVTCADATAWLPGRHSARCCRSSGNC